jgi:hypothetical protein
MGRQRKVSHLGLAARAGLDGAERRVAAQEASGHQVLSGAVRVAGGARVVAGWRLLSHGAHRQRQQKNHAAPHG